jgi:hypothetical protein
MMAMAIHSLAIGYTGWWFGTFFIPTDSYFRGVETTNQYTLD